MGNIGNNQRMNLQIVEIPEKSKISSRELDGCSGKTNIK
jgi:hypothetical protein